MTPAILHTQLDIRGPPAKKLSENFGLWSASRELRRAPGEDLLNLGQLGPDARQFHDPFRPLMNNVGKGISYGGHRFPEMRLPSRLRFGI
jgi:hypothetical protein